LVGLSAHRSAICANAIDSGGYTREELAALVAQQGFDTSFLFQPEPQSDASLGQVEKTTLGRADNVVSLPEYREQELRVSDDYESGKEFEAVSAAIEHLVEEGVLEPAQGIEIVKATIVETALSDDSGFETELQGDDFGAFVKKHEQSKPTMKV